MVQPCRQFSVKTFPLLHTPGARRLVGQAGQTTVVPFRKIREEFHDFPNVAAPPVAKVKVQESAHPPHGLDNLSLIGLSEDARIRAAPCEDRGNKFESSPLGMARNVQEIGIAFYNKPGLGLFDGVTPGPQRVKFILGVHCGSWVIQPGPPPDNT
jgi:hypothetical protein